MNLIKQNKTARSMIAAILLLLTLIPAARVFAQADAWTTQVKAK